MWLVVNRTPYAALGGWIQDKAANKIWHVVVKATFDILANGTTRLADEQAPVYRMGVPRGELGKSSLLYEADMAAFKPLTDVLVNGSAWAAPGTRAESVEVQVSVDSWSKRLRVFGDRVWQRRLVGGVDISRPERFESMPITYERAYGGWDRSAPDPQKHRLDVRNPVGTGFAARAEHCLGMRLPNVEYPQHLIGSWKDRPPTAGLNAIDCAWSPRRELAGTYDDAWRSHRFPLWAEDYDERYANCAPADQQLPSRLRGGETVRLVNLSARGDLTFLLPKIYPVFQTRFGAERTEHRAHLATVIVEPDAPRVIMAWQTCLTCNHRVDELDSTIVAEKRLA